MIPRLVPEISPLDAIWDGVVAVAGIGILGVGWVPVHIDEKVKTEISWFHLPLFKHTPDDAPTEQYLCSVKHFDAAEFYLEFR